MPRPKRTKVASTVPQPRVTVPSPISARHLPRQPSSSSTKEIRETQNEKDEAKSVEKPDHNDDDIRGMPRPTHAISVKSQQRGRRRAVVRKQPDETQKRALDELIKRKEEASKGQSALQTEAASRQPLTATRSNLVPQRATSSNLMKVTSPARGRGSTKRLSMGMASDRDATPPAYDPDDDLYALSPGGEISLAKIQAENFDDTSRSKITKAPASALRVRSTPAAEASILALANFKRRPRQPSIIRQVQLASETGDRYDFDDLEPEDESTPLHLNKRRTRSSLNLQHEKSAAPATSSSRKRKFSEVQVPATQRSPLLASSPPPSPRHASSRGLSSSPTLPSRQHGLPPRPASPTLADPLSSSSAAPADDVPSARASKRRRPSHAPHAAPKTRLAAKTRASAAVSTAALQSLLPKPRRGRAARRAAPFDVPSDGDDDEPDDVRGTPAKGKGVGGGVEAVKGRRTYGKGAGRRGGSDKENESDAGLSESGGSEDDEGDGMQRRARSRTVEMRDVVLSKRMQDARRKFHEVDEWEMEFESVDLGASGSSWR